MSKYWGDSPELVETVAGDLLLAAALFPREMIRIDDLVHTFGMPFSQIQILTLVYHQDLTVGQLSRRMNIAKPNVTPLVGLMEEQGLVRRERNGVDRRIVRVCIQPAGRQRMEEIRERVEKQMLEWPSQLNRSEIRALQTSLETLIRISGSLQQ